MSATDAIAAAIAAGPTLWLPPLPPELPDVPPLTGTVPLDAIAAELHGNTSVDLDDPDQRRTFTAVLVAVGPPALVAAYLSRSQLIADWPHLPLAGPVRERWQAAFSELPR